MPDPKCDSDIFQAVRVIDVLVLGPVMINAGRQIGGPAGVFLAVSGVLTIIFNGLTFWEIENQ